MNNLVERLRGWDPTPEDCQEAADEIDRLQTSLSNAVEVQLKLQIENERLRAEVVRVAALGVPGF
jgi:hypothetical protein